MAEIHQTLLSELFIEKRGLALGESYPRQPSYKLNYKLVPKAKQSRYVSRSRSKMSTKKKKCF
jgi:hypothetical protein